MCKFFTNRHFLKKLPPGVLPKQVLLITLMILQHRYLPVKDGKFLRTPIFIEHLGTTGSFFFFFLAKFQVSTTGGFYVMHLF